MSLRNTYLQYDFTTIQNGTTVPDLSPNQLNASLDPATQCSIGNDPEFGVCLQFGAATGNGVVLPELKKFNTSNGFSFTTWVNFSSLPNQASIFNLAASATDSASWIGLFYNALAGLYFGFSNGTVVKTLTVASPAIAAKQWVHLAVTIDALGAGAIFINGASQAAKSAPEPTTTFVLPTDMNSFSSNFIGGNIWNTIAPGYVTTFNGKMAWASIYTVALGGEAVVQDMVLGRQKHTANFSANFPVNFSLYSKFNNDDFPVLYIQSDNSNNNLFFEISNTSGQILNLQQGTGAVSAHNFHFRLAFRNGILSSQFIQTAATNAQTIGDWSMIGVEEAGNGVYFYFLYTGSGVSIAPNTSQTIEIPAVGANPVGGARNTTVQFSYRSVFPASSAVALKGTRLQNLSLVNHTGQKDLPLHCSIVGVPNVLNDGKTSNALTFRLVNMGTDPIALSTNPEGATYLELIVPTDEDGTAAGWQLVGKQNVASLNTVVAGNTVGLHFSTSATVGNSTVFQITNLPASIAVGGSIEFELNGIITNTSSGQSFIQIAYSNVPGYWDGQFMIPVSKGPLVIDDQAVNIGSKTLPVELNVSGTTIMGETLDVLGATTLNSSLTVTDQVNLNSNLSVTGEAAADSIQIPYSPSDTSSITVGNGQGAPPAGVLIAVPSVSTVNYPLLLWGQTSAGGPMKQLFSLDQTGQLCSGGEPLTVNNDAMIKKGLTVSDTTQTIQLNVGVPLLCADNQMQINGNPGGAHLFLKNSNGWSGDSSVLINLGDDTHYIQVVCGTGMTIHDANGVVISGPSLKVSAPTTFSEGATFSDTIKCNSNNVFSAQSGQHYSAYIHNMFTNDIGQNGGFFGPSTWYNGYPTSSATQVNVDLIATNAIQARGYIVVSDQRIKEHFQVSDAAQDLQNLLQIEVTDYQYIDIVQHGTDRKKGLVAQQLEQVFPEAVNRGTAFIPNIFAVVSEAQLSENSELTLTLAKAHGLQVGDRVKIITNNEEIEKEVVAMSNDLSFTISNWTATTEQLFVYGKEVNDFRTIDYDAVSMLGVSAIQELHREVEGLKKENQSLQQQLTNEMQSLRAEMAAMKTQMLQ